MQHRDPTTRRALVALAALLLLSASAVLAARGGGTTTAPNALLVFDDLDGDAIGSDGLGAYDATLENGLLTVEAGRKRGFYMDFSGYLEGDPTSPLGSADARVVSGATLRIDLETGAAWWIFSGTSGDLLLSTTVDVTPIDDNGDGTIDRYSVTTTGDAVHDLYRLIKNTRRGAPPGSYTLEWRSSYSMPWGAEADPD